MRAAESGAASPSRAALTEYDLGTVLSLDPLPAGSPAVRKVTSSSGSYLLKPAHRGADVDLQARVAPLLASRGIRQPRIVPTAGGALVSSAGYFLQEFLPGAALLDPAPLQVTAAMRHIAGYLHALGQLPVSYQPELSSVWVRVTDPDFLAGELPGLLSRYRLPGGDAAALGQYLGQSRSALAGLPRQLVHGDIGPDNVLMNDTEVVAVIDFTPHLLPAVLAACTALYWYHVHGKARPVTAQLTASFAAMNAVRPWTAAEHVALAAGLAWEALRRIATPLELARERHEAPGPSVAPRLAALRTLVHLLPELGAELIC